MAKGDKGICPNCEAMELDYGALGIQDDLVYYPFTCENCGHEDKEWYSLEFIGFNT